MSDVRWLTVFVDVPEPEYETRLAFWSRVTGGQPSPVRGPAGAFVTVLPPDGDAALRVQRVVDGDGGYHLDLHVDAGSLVAFADRAVALGARAVRAEAGLIVLESPGGLPFCVVRWEGESRVPAPEVDPQAGRNRLDQICLDIPPDRHEAEVAFWAALTEWPWHPGSRPEFSYLERPAGIAWRILLQRRDRAEAGDPVTAHLDFAADDVAGLAERHAGAGATVVARFGVWTTLTDPAGRAYCVTGRDPVTGGRPTA